MFLHSCTETGINDQVLLTSEVIEGHVRSSFQLFVLNLILSKFGMNASTIETQIFHNMTFNLKAH